MRSWIPRGLGGQRFAGNLGRFSQQVVPGAAGLRMARWGRPVGFIVFNVANVWLNV